MDLGGPKREAFNFGASNLITNTNVFTCNGKYNYPAPTMPGNNKDPRLPYSKFRHYEAGGYFLGQIVRNSCQAYLNLPLFFYDWLLLPPGEVPTPTFQDLEDIRPTEANILKQFKADPLKIPEYTYFQVNYKVGDVVLSKNLIENGGEVELTSENLDLYTSLYVKFFLVDNIKTEFFFLSRGFFKAVTSKLLDNFSPQVRLIIHFETNKIDGKIFLGLGKVSKPFYGMCL